MELVMGEEAPGFEPLALPCDALEASLEAEG